MNNSAFGNLTINKSAIHIKKLMSNNNYAIDYIFNNSDNHLDNLSVFEAERKIAFEHLRDLTKRLQSNRIKQNAKVFCKYFSD